MKSLFLFFFIISFTGNLWGGEFEVATYNLHNLFDSKHDKGKNDYDFLPVFSQEYIDYQRKRCESPQSEWDIRACENPKPKDWTKDKVALKVSQIKEVLESRGKLPDILTITEIENKEVASQLAKALGYRRLIITNGPDKRGIDVAVFYKMNKNLIATNYVKGHIVETDKEHPTRPILEVKFLFRSQRRWNSFHLFVNHWPSQHAPNSMPRLIAARKLKKLMGDIIKHDKQAIVLATGDFNTTENGKKDNPHPFNDELLINSKGEKNNIFDLQKHYTKMVKEGSIEGKKMPPGTYYYGKKNTWSYFDRFFVSKNLIDKKGIEVDIESYEIYAPGFMTKVHTQKNWETGEILWVEERAPWKYWHATNEADKAGFSDHFPIFVTIRD